LPSQQTCLREARVPSSPDDYVVVYGDVQQSAGRDELLGDRAIVRRRHRIAAGMIVDEDDRRRPLGDRLSKNLARVHEGRRQQPTRDRHIAFQPMLRVEHGHVKLLDGQVFRPDPSKPASWNRGAYLVNGPGHCAECHSERNFAGGIVEDRRFAGGPDPEGGRGTVPNITPHQSGIGGWSPEEVATLLKTGETPNFDTVGGPMGAVVANTAQLPDADRQAMAEYLLSLPPKQGFKKPE